MTLQFRCMSTSFYLRTFCNTVAAGSAQIQRDIYAARVLGLPRAR